MYLILLWKWLLGWTHNWEEVNSSSWWKKVQMQGRNIAAVNAMEQPCCRVMMRPFTEHHSLPPYPGPLWQAKNVKVQEKERLHTLNCPDKTVIVYDSFCPINLEQKWTYTECHLPYVLRIMLFCMNVVEENSFSLFFLGRCQEIPLRLYHLPLFHSQILNMN